MIRTIFTLLAVIIMGTTLAFAQADVTFTVVDSTEQYVNITFKGTPTGWADTAMYDDGTHGDPVAGDHRWTVIIENIPEGDHEWGATEGPGGTWRWRD